MKKIKTNVIVSCLVLTTTKVPLWRFLLHCSPIKTPKDDWGKISLKNLYTLQHHAMTNEDFFSETGSNLPIKIYNAFVIHTGKILGRKSSALIIHLKMDRDTFVKIKNKYLVPKFTIGQIGEGRKAEYIVELGSFQVMKEALDPMSTTPVILGEQLEP